MSTGSLPEDRSGFRPKSPMRGHDFAEIKAPKKARKALKKAKKIKVTVTLEDGTFIEERLAVSR